MSWIRTGVALVSFYAGAAATFRNLNPTGLADGVLGGVALAGATFVMASYFLDGG